MNALIAILLTVIVTGCSSKNATTPTVVDDTKDAAGSESAGDAIVFGVKMNSDTPVENLGAVDCPQGERCLVIEANTEFCSVDPESLEAIEQTHGASFFATKSRLTIPAGSYSVDADKTLLPDIPITIHTPRGESVLLPVDGLVYEHRPAETDPDLPTQREAIVIQRAFASDAFSIGRLTMIVPHIEIYPDIHFRLGDSTDIWWWIGSARHIVVSEAKGSLLTDPPHSITFAPCELTGRPNDVFTFDFGNGDKMDLTIRSAFSSITVGHSVVRLISAAGTFGGEEVSVTDPYKLTAMWQWGDVRMPDMVVRMDERDGFCGVVFDPYNPGFNWGGWRAYKLMCDETRGEEIPLVDAVSPDGYNPP